MENRFTDAGTEHSADRATALAGDSVAASRGPSLAGIDLPRVTEWLATAIGMEPPLALARVGLGQSNLTYLVTDSKRRRVILRRPPLGELARGAHDMVREHRILSALADQAVPAPRPLALCTDLSVTGAPLYLMEVVDGIVLHTNAAGERLNGQARAQVGASVAQALAALHNVDIDAAGLSDFARQDSYAERQLRGWSRQWEATKTRELPLIERTADALRTAIPPQNHVSVVHGDYNLANLIVAADGSVRAILDWELCTLGDPIADVGTLLCYWPDRLDQRVLERDPVPLLPGFVSRAEILKSYAEAAPDRDLASVDFWLALATWKLAIILEGVMRRRMANAENGSTGVEELHRATDELAVAAATLRGVA
jgi:aminoglycoside phosphotransferase (APT) family kinase protein